ncbi:hypothetical protein HDU76_002031 [Blyttiomyces sp. JEL0837]|nr:hypothetical protein HDU76_002031 [Blyttiomyces sp. JEL0837]
MAKDHIADHGEYELLGAYFSPVSSGYKKGGLAPHHHRVRMCQLAVQDSDFMMVDDWEARQPEAQRTAVVLEHFEECLNGTKDGGIVVNGKRKRINIMFIAGGDLIQSFADFQIKNGEKIPLWSPQDLDIILGKFGCLVIERTGADVHDYLLSNQKLFDHRKKVHVIKQLIHNDISSTKIRLFIKRNMSIKYLLPDAVVEYIKRKRLYIIDEPRTAAQELEMGELLDYDDYVPSKEVKEEDENEEGGKVVVEETEEEP